MSGIRRRRESQCRMPCCGNTPAERGLIRWIHHLAAVIGYAHRSFNNQEPSQ